MKLKQKNLGIVYLGSFFFLWNIMFLDTIKLSIKQINKIYYE